MPYNNIILNEIDINQLENSSDISIQIIEPINISNSLKTRQNNIYLELENKYGFNISKKLEVQYF
jgi:hypothetical protein